jgi:uncharacterized spore protein YtfJ
MAERVSASASVKNVYGDPVVLGNRTVIPAAQVRDAFGGGGGNNEQESGGGGGAFPRGHAARSKSRRRGPGSSDSATGQESGLRLHLGFYLARLWWC